MERYRKIVGVKFYIIAIYYTLTKTNEHLSNTNEPQETFFNSPGENHTFYPLTKPKTNQSRRWKYTKPDIQKQCLLCDTKFMVKYILPKKQYSQKNNWGYWTKKASDQHKYLCNTCLVKLHVGKMSDWIKCQSRADVFYNYFKRGQFNQN